MSDTQAPPGATAMERAEALWQELQDNKLGGYSGINRPFWIAVKFREVEREARAAALKEAAQWHDDGAANADYGVRVSLLDHKATQQHKAHARWHRYAAEQIRALAVKPAAET